MNDNMTNKIGWLLVIIFLIGMGLFKLAAFRWDVRCFVVECRIMK
jgi:hypothetical protein